MAATGAVLLGGPNQVQAGAASNDCANGYYCFSDNSNLYTGSTTTSMYPGYRAPFTEWDVGLYNERYGTGVRVAFHVGAIRNRNLISGDTLCLYEAGTKETAELVIQARYYGESWKKLTSGQRSRAAYFQQLHSQLDCPRFPS